MLADIFPPLFFNKENKEKVKRVHGLTIIVILNTYNLRNCEITNLITNHILSI